MVFRTCGWTKLNVSANLSDVRRALSSTQRIGARAALRIVRSVVQQQTVSDVIQFQTRLYLRMKAVSASARTVKHLCSQKILANVSTAILVAQYAGTETLTIVYHVLTARISSFSQVSASRNALKEHRSTIILKSALGALRAALNATLMTILFVWDATMGSHYTSRSAWLNVHVATRNHEMEQFASLVTTLSI